MLAQDRLDLQAENLRQRDGCGSVVQEAIDDFLHLPGPHGRLVVHKNYPQWWRGLERIEWSTLFPAR